MTKILHILEFGALIILWNKVSLGWWVVLAIILFLLYCAGKTYYTALSDGSDIKVVRLWYHVRSLVFITDIILVIILYVLIFWGDL